MSGPRMTPRQEAAVQQMVTEARTVYGVEISSTASLDIIYAEETRPGRGHALWFWFIDGEQAVCGTCDVYGYGQLVVADVSVVHNSADDECDCAPCRAANGTQL